MRAKDAPTVEQIAAWRAMHCDGRTGWSAEDMLAMLIRGDLSVAECRRAIAGSRTADREPWEHGNPMQSDDLLMMHVMYDATTEGRDTYAIVARGTFFETSRAAPEQIAAVVDIPIARLNWWCHLAAHDGSVLRIRTHPTTGRMLVDVVRPEKPQ